MGRVGVITHRERHDGGFNIVHMKDAIDNSFATRETNVFVIGSEKPWVSLPKGKGVYVILIISLNGTEADQDDPANYRSQRRGTVAVRMQLLDIRFGEEKEHANRHRSRDRVRSKVISM